MQNQEIKKLDLNKILLLAIFICASILAYSLVFAEDTANKPATSPAVQSISPSDIDFEEEDNGLFEDEGDDFMGELRQNHKAFYKELREKHKAFHRELRELHKAFHKKAHDARKEKRRDLKNEIREIKDEIRNTKDEIRRKKDKIKDLKDEKKREEVDAVRKEIEALREDIKLKRDKIRDIREERKLKNETQVPLASPTETRGFDPQPHPSPTETRGSLPHLSPTETRGFDPQPHPSPAATIEELSGAKVSKIDTGGGLFVVIQNGREINVKVSGATKFIVIQGDLQTSASIEKLSIGDVAQIVGSYNKQTGFFEAVSVLVTK